MLIGSQSTQLNTYSGPLKTFLIKYEEGTEHKRKSGGPGVPIEKIPRHTIRVEQSQLNLFLEFTVRSYYHQDVA